MKQSKRISTILVLCLFLQIPALSHTLFQSKFDLNLSHSVQNNSVNDSSPNPDLPPEFDFICVCPHPISQAMAIDFGLKEDTSLEIVIMNEDGEVAVSIDPSTYHKGKSYIRLGRYLKGLKKGKYMVFIKSEGGAYSQEIYR